MEDWAEIWESLRKNKLRTFLTGFSVAWGIFILIILVSCGSGLKAFVSGLFSNDMDNTMYIYPSTTSLPYKGNKPGRRIKFKNKDLELIRQKVKDIELISARYFVNGGQVVYGNEKGSFSIRCVHPDHRWIEASKVLQGRYINPQDITQFRKSAVLGLSVKEKLFGKKEAVGEMVSINAVPFKVVGVFTDESEEDERRMVYLPVSTAQRVFGDGEEISAIVFTIGNPSIAQSLKREAEIKTVLGESTLFDVQDSKAIQIVNKLKSMERINGLLDSIRLFTFFIGMLSIVSGSIGVMNIMVVSVKERTKEIGLRRAIGATPYAIISSIIKEAVFITMFFGYMGLLAGAGLLSLINSLAGEGSSFRNLLVDLPLALMATGILVLVGVVSGLFPAFKASKIRPVEALNSN